METQFPLNADAPRHADSTAPNATLADAPPHPKRWLWPALLGGAMFPVFFYDTGTGLNTLCWTALLLLVTAVRRPPASWSRSIWQAGAGLSLAAICCAIHGSTLAFITWVICICWWIATVQLPQVRQLPLLVWASVEMHTLHLLRALQASVRAIVQSTGKTLGIRQEAVAALLALPIILLFLVLYREGSTAFANLTSGIATTLEQWLANLPEAAPGIIFAACFAFCWLVLMLYPAVQTRWLQRQDAMPDHHPVPVGDESLIARLRAETGFHTVLLVSLNLLVLALNLTDISTYWLGLGPERIGKAHLVSEVYEGTGALVFSILLVMGIVLYQFRPGAKLNPAHPRLLGLALVWLAQNALLVINVAVRDAAYMDQRGLAYKRLLLLCFLILCLWGLWTLSRKIVKGYSLGWLLHRNIAAVLVVLLALSTVNWDYQIAHYNLSTQPAAEIDYGFLLDMHASALPLLLEKEADIKACSDRQKLNYRLDKFNADWQRVDWRSWSLARHQAYQQLKGKPRVTVDANCPAAYERD